MIKPWLMSCLLVLSLGVAAVPAVAEPVGSTADIYAFDDEILTARFTMLSQLLRCPKCQDQNISDSDADIASDMRRKTAQLLRDGYSDEQIVAYFVERYGDFVTYKPPVRKDTILLWAAPLIAFLVGLLLVVVQLFKARKRLQHETGNTGETP